MAEIKNLQSLSKTSAGSNDVLLVTNTSTNQAKKYTLTNFFPSLSTVGTSSEAFFINVTNKNQLNFKGIKSATTSMLTMATVSNNVELTVVPAGIDLNLCDNTKSQFTKGVNFNTIITGSCPVSNGGTGVTGFATGSILVATSTNTLGAQTMTAHGQLLIGNATTGYPSVATLTAGANISITNTAGAISIAGTFAGLTADLDCNTFDINLDRAAGISWVSGDGSKEGISVDANGKVFIGDSTPTAPTIGGQLHLIGNTAQAIVIGNNNNYKSTYSVGVMTPNSGTAGGNLEFYASAGGGGNDVGGYAAVYAGAGIGSGAGGHSIIRGGDAASGTPGSVKLNTYTTGGADTTALTVDSAQDVTVNSGSLIITGAAEGIVHTNSGTVTQASDHTTGVTLNASSGVITLAAVALGAATNAEFTFTNSTIQADSVILLTVQDENTTNNAQLTAAILGLDAGHCEISIHNPAATGSTSTTASKIHFLVINNSV